MTTQAEKAVGFLALHRKGDPLLMPNPWDIGSARLLAHAGFQALATTSSGFAASIGRLDYGVTKQQAVEHGAAIAGAVDVPVSADFENGFADDPEGVAETIGMAIDAGLAGCSVEDSTGVPGAPIYAINLAVERVAAAAETAHRGSAPLTSCAPWSRRSMSRSACWSARECRSCQSSPRSASLASRLAVGSPTRPTGRCWPPPASCLRNGATATVRRRCGAPVQSPPWPRFGRRTPLPRRGWSLQRDRQQG